eukprot:CAMPEP_0172463770 /NCGR_PEP_ID=MMETSP1065-20121228/48351_1 /TAXON_ID=265537 /ORGANISM="Amphiprora paludosa, Strain CCMP125" /LENGTH=187 /DNA_ID=CAMNT_0013219809 /DNA_START=35 /DNA_END=598 /DNA_ORIENTATION=-
MNSSPISLHRNSKTSPVKVKRDSKRALHSNMKTIFMSFQAGDESNISSASAFSSNGTRRAQNSNRQDDQDDFLLVFPQSRNARTGSGRSGLRPRPSVQPNQRAIITHLRMPATFSNEMTNIDSNESRAVNPVATPSPIQLSFRATTCDTSSVESGLGRSVLTTPPSNTQIQPSTLETPNSKLLLPLF